MAETSGMRLERNTVFVLGAGFTKAFLPGAPLLIDDYGAVSLQSEFKRFPTALRVLESEMDRKDPNRIDLERVMTRASAGVPYDSEMGASEELSLLFSKLKASFESKLQTARNGEVHEQDLAALARLCVERRIACVTFNYDDLLDEALWEVKRLIEADVGGPCWHPDGGYGFFCRPAWVMSGTVPAVRMGNVAMHLLKLHGSINWRVRLGYSSPLSPDALVHSEGWFPRLGVDDPDTEELERHMEKSPFLVPPILTKDELVREPILRLIWTRAFAALASADLVVFVGYSFPVTDIAARFLFTEAIRPETRLQVVNHARTETSQAALRARYREALGVQHHQFTFEDALEWSRRLTGKYLRASSS